MVQFKIFCCVASFLVLSACTKEIPFEGDSDEPKLVLNGILNIDSTFSVSVERSVFFLSNDPSSSQELSNSEIIVENLSTGQTFTMNEPTQGSNYDFPFAVSTNTKYSIVVKNPEYDDIRAETATLSNIDIIAVDTMSYSPSEFESRMRFTMEWNDPDSEENYYLLRVRVIDNSVGSNYPLYLISNDPAVNNTSNTDIDGTVYETEQLLFSDETFNGTTKELVFSSYKPYFLEDPNSTDAQIQISLISMDRNTFLYLQSVFLYNQTDFFSEPVKIYSNIEDGFGIFGFFNHSMLEL